mmetsp:Transcript_28240/g.51367  ORF Transcript_28240/g.51367 Transcript_28240/m.51367 type:complete len:216 (+) Transcript_28240:1825-2472(+)
MASSNGFQVVRHSIFAYLLVDHRGLQQQGRCVQDVTQIHGLSEDADKLLESTTSHYEINCLLPQWQLRRTLLADLSDLVRKLPKGRLNESSSLQDVNALVEVAQIDCLDLCPQDGRRPEVLGKLCHTHPRTVQLLNGCFVLLLWGLAEAQGIQQVNHEPKVPAIESSQLLLDCGWPSSCHSKGDQRLDGSRRLLRAAASARRCCSARRSCSAWRW